MRAALVVGALVPFALFGWRGWIFALPFALAAAWAVPRRVR